MAYDDGAVFDFGFSGEMSRHPTDTQIDDGSVKCLHEEGLETLFMLNLRVIFPEWDLAVRRASGAFGGPDLLAVDPIGTLHVFEFKYGADSSTSLLQAVAYALSSTMDPRWSALVRRSPSWTPEYLARRLAGVWFHVRTGTSSGDEARGTPPRVEDRARLNKITGEHAERYLDVARAHVARLTDADKHPLSDMQLRPSVHLHLVAPNGPKEPVVREAQELLGRGIHISIWSARVSLDRPEESGRLRLQAHPVTLVRNKKPIERVSFPAPQFLARCLRATPALRANNWTWHHDTLTWVDPLGRFFLQVWFHSRPMIYFGPKSPTHVRKAKKPVQWPQQYKRDRQFCSRFLQAILPPPGGLRPSLGQLSKSVKYTCKFESEILDVWCGGGGSTKSKIYFPESGTLVCGQLLAKIIDAVKQARLDGFLQAYEGIDLGL